MSEAKIGRSRRRKALEYAIALVFLPVLIAAGLLLFLRVTWIDWRERRAEQQGRAR